jgi:hypothetical protein
MRGQQRHHSGGVRLARESQRAVLEPHARRDERGAPGATRPPRRVVVQRPARRELDLARAGMDALHQLVGVGAAELARDRGLEVDAQPVELPLRLRVQRLARR